MSETLPDLVSFYFRQNSFNGPMWVTGSHPGEAEMFIPSALIVEIVEYLLF